MLAKLAPLAALLALLATACTTSSNPTGASGSAESSGPGRTVTVRQDDGKTVYWVLPGKRRLSPEVFGTPEYPLRTGESLIEQAPDDVQPLLERLPLLVGIPEGARETGAAGEEYTTTKEPVPVGDEGRIVDGSFSVTYGDRQPYDWPGEPFRTGDEIEASATFTDPAGDTYEITVDRLFQPPIPGWQTGGGVLTDSWIHGTTGTDSPLFPTSFAYGTFWGVGDVSKNGEVVDEDKWVHFMTTQIVRNSEYRLATNEELPLAPDETIAGKLHHTHVIVRPITISDDGSMSFEPVETGFELPNGQTQPYLHLMYEQDELEGSAFAGWTPPEASPAPSAPTDEDGKAVELDVSAEEFAFSPAELDLSAGEPATVVLTNEGEIAHNITIPELDLRSETIQPGESIEVAFTPAEEGDFTFFCRVPGHQEAGMEGTLTVS